MRPIRTGNGRVGTLGGGVCAIQLRVEKVIRVAAGEEAAGWRNALSAPGVLDGAKVLKEDGGSWVRRATVMGRDVVVKCRVMNTVGRRVKHWVGMGHGAKHWRGAELLEKQKVRTAKVWALARGRCDGCACELLVMEYLDGPTVLECMRDATEGRLSVRQQHRIARAVGLQMIEMGWLLNRDHKPSNLIVLHAESETPEVAVIDCVGVRKVQVLRTERMLASLVIEPTGCGVRPRRALMMQVLWSANEELDKHHEFMDYESWDVDERPSANPRVRVREDSRREWIAVQKLVEEHGDPRPRVDPLGKR